MSVIVGIDDEPRMIDGAPIIPWHVLNDYNRERSGNEDPHSADSITGN